MPSFKVIWAQEVENWWSWTGYNDINSTILYKTRLFVTILKILRANYSFIGYNNDNEQNCRIIACNFAHSYIMLYNESMAVIFVWIDDCGVYRSSIPWVYRLVQFVMIYGASLKFAIDQGHLGTKGWKLVVKDGL